MAGCLGVAKLAGLGFLRFNLLVAFDAGLMGGSVGPRYCLLVHNVPVTVNTSEFQLLNMQPVGDLNVVRNLHLFFLNVSMAEYAVRVDKIIFCGVSVRE